MVADRSLPVLPELFAQAGYRTAAFVQLEGGETYRRGFQSYNRGRPEGPSAGWIDRRGADVVGARRARRAVLRDRLDRWLAEVARLQRRVARPGGVELSPQKRQRLEALGYLR